MALQLPVIVDALYMMILLTVITMVHAPRYPSCHPNPSDRHDHRLARLIGVASYRYTLPTKTRAIGWVGNETGVYLLTFLATLKVCHDK